MGLLDFFNKNRNAPSSANNGLHGPTYFEGLTEDIVNPKNLQSHEWRRKLKSTSGHGRFRIKYYGTQHKRYPSIIVGTEHAPALVVAIDVSTGQEIVLFDGCKHGYNAMFCDEFTKEQVENRPASLLYKDPKGNEIFEITISTLNGCDFDGEFLNDVDDKGQIKLLDGTIMDFEMVKRNAFDVLQITGTTEAGNAVEIVSEELA